MLDTSNTPSPLNTTPRPDELTSVRKLPVMFGQVPNITGAADWASGTTGGGKGSGSLLFNTGGTSFCQYGEPGKGDVYINLNAASGNAIYGGSTVQPKALQCLPCIRC